MKLDRSDKTRVEIVNELSQYSHIVVQIKLDSSVDYNTSEYIICSAPVKMEITDIAIRATTSVTDAKVTVYNAHADASTFDPVCDDIGIAVEGSVYRMASGIDDGQMTLDAGDKIAIQSSQAGISGVIVITGVRV